MNDISRSSPPLVSVILPVHNGEHTVQQAVQSVLSQRYKPIEIIMVDDGSTDGTARLAAGFADRVKYFFQAHAGPAAARNLGIRKSGGDFITFIDDDDLWPEDKVAAQMRCFEAFPQVEIVQGLVKRVRLDGSGYFGAGAESEPLFVASNLGAMIVRRSVFTRIGDLDERLRYHEDTDFWFRALEAGIRVLLQHRLALLYRVHGRSVTAGVDLQTLGIAGIVRRSLLRRRQPSGAVAKMRKLLSFADLEGTTPGQDLNARPQALREPLVSVILYLRGGFEDPAPAIRSIIDQDYPSLELVTVAARPEMVRLPSMGRFQGIETIQGHLDLASGLNAALERCHGQMVAFLDAAGEWAPGKLKLQVHHLLENRGDQYVAGRTRQILMPDRMYPEQLIESLVLRKGLGDLLPTLLARRSVFARIGGFRGGLSGMEETDWILRAKDARIPNRTLPQVAFFRFVRPDAYRLAVDDAKRALLASVRSSIDRKRSAPPMPS